MQPNEQQTLSTAANAVELATRVVYDVAGNEVANTLGQVTQSRDDMRVAVATRLNLELIRKGVNQ